MENQDVKNELISTNNLKMIQINLKVIREVQKEIKVAWIIFSIMILGIIFHNISFALTGFEDAIFFLIGILSFFALIIYSIYLLILFIYTKAPRNLYQLGWMGVVLFILFLLAGVNNFYLYLLPFFYCSFFLLKLKRIFS